MDSKLLTLAVILGSFQLYYQ